MAKKKKQQAPLSEQLRLPAGPVDLSTFDTRATPGFSGDKAASRHAIADMAAELSDLQECLHANGVEGDPRRILLVLQGMDTSGKGGVVRHSVGLLDPQGVQLTSFKVPTAEEKRHPFLWRIRNALPDAGKVGVFDRSHYEDVLVVRVHELAPARTWRGRYSTINRFEEKLAADGCTIIKCFLHISPDKQQERLLARLDDPTKHWKYNPGDVDERELWPAYTEAYEEALERCNTDAAPWHVIPSDRKWYRNWAVTTLLLDALRGMDLQWPKADFDVEEERERLMASTATLAEAEDAVAEDTEDPEAGAKKTRSKKSKRSKKK